MRRVDVEERRARLARRHHLAVEDRATTVTQAARSVVALHSSDPVTVFLSARARIDGATVQSIERALYEERSVVRMLGMRRTLFVPPRELRPVIQSACTDAIAARERKRLLGWIGASGIDDPAGWLRRAERATMRLVAERGETATAELTKAVSHLSRKIVIGQGEVGRDRERRTRVLPLLAADGALVRGRAARLLGQRPVPLGDTAAVARRQRSPSTADGPGRAPAALARGFRPGDRDRHPLVDRAGRRGSRDRRSPRCRTRRSSSTARRAAYLLADDLETMTAPSRGRRCSRRSIPTTMGWKERDWYLGAAPAATLFDVERQRRADGLVGRARRRRLVAARRRRDRRSGCSRTSARDAIGRDRGRGRAPAGLARRDVR